MELGVKEVFEKYDLSTSLGFLLDKENNDVSKIDATFNFLNSHIGIISKQKKNRRYWCEGKKVKNLSTSDIR